MADAFNTIGKPHWRVDGIAKVTGRARYAADLGAPGMLFGRVLLARRPHARIVSLDTSAARALPGVHAVLTAADLPFARVFGVVIQNQPVLAGDKVRHYGDAIAMVAAEREEIAEEALSLIRVEFEDLPAVFDPEEAMAPGAPVIHQSENALSGDQAADQPAHSGDQLILPNRSPSSPASWRGCSPSMLASQIRCRRIFPAM